MPKKSKLIQVPMPEELLATLDSISHEQDVSRSALIREACVEYIATSKKAEDVRRYVESYTKYPEKDEGNWRELLAAEVWGEEDFSDWEK
ncbi:MAG: CopG family transcriptional regulator [Chloroflexota bacterium]